MKILFRTAATLAMLALVGLGLSQNVAAQSNRPYRVSDAYVRNLLQRLETSTDQFSNLLPAALDQSQISGTQREDQINTLVTNFENRTSVLRDRFNNDQLTTT